MMEVFIGKIINCILSTYFNVFYKDIPINNFFLINDEKWH
jgi:hypothetical protein